MIDEQLLNAFPLSVRSEFVHSLHKSYEQADVEAKQFGSFANRARGYLQHFWSDALLEKCAKELNLSHGVELNRAGNTPFLVIRSSNWQLSNHHVTKGRRAPSKALYREHYTRMNDLFADAAEAEIATLHRHGYVQLVHSGEKLLDDVTLIVPNRNMTGAVYTEALDLLVPVETDREEIPDQLKDQIRIKAENMLRNATKDR